MTCARYGPAETANVTQQAYLNLHVRSQVIGLQMLLAGTMFLAVCLAIKQCCIKANPGKGMFKMNICCYLLVTNIFCC